MIESAGRKFRSDFVPEEIHVQRPILRRRRAAKGDIALRVVITVAGGDAEDPRRERTVHVDEALVCPDIRRVLPDDDPELVPLRGIESDDVRAGALPEIDIATDLIAVELVHRQSGKIGPVDVGIPARCVIGLRQRKSDGATRGLSNDKVSLAAVACDITVSCGWIRLNAGRLLSVPMKRVKRERRVARRRNPRAKSQRYPRVHDIGAASVGFYIVSEINLPIAWVCITIVPRVAGVLHAQVINAVFRNEIGAARSVIHSKDTVGSKRAANNRTVPLVGTVAVAPSAVQGRKAAGIVRDRELVTIVNVRPAAWRIRVSNSATDL